MVAGTESWSGKPRDYFFPNFCSCWIANGIYGTRSIISRAEHNQPRHTFIHSFILPHKYVHIQHFEMKSLKAQNINHWRFENTFTLLKYIVWMEISSIPFNSQTIAFSFLHLLSHSIFSSRDFLYTFFFVYSGMIANNN